MDLLTTILPFVLVIIFPLFWCGVCLLISRLGGWSRLAEYYADDEEFHGTTHVWQSGAVGWANYRGCLNLSVSEEGLGMSVMFLFRVGHRPLFIPWDQFHGIEEKQVFFHRFFVADVGYPTITRLRLPLCVRERVSGQSG